MGALEIRWAKNQDLRKSYLKMTSDERAELARQAEVALKTGLGLMGKDKKLIQDLIALVDAPTR